MAVFRFAQRLSQILQGRNLTAEEVAGLDRYDLEIEDRVDSGGDTVWEVGSADVSSDTVQLSADHQSMFVGLPIGTAGYASVTLSPGNARDNSGSTDTFLYLYSAGDNATGYANLETSAIDVTATAGDVNITAAGGGVALTATGDTMVLLATNSNNIYLTLIGGGFLRFTGLPTSNPGPSNIVWNDAGTLKIT